MASSNPDTPRDNLVEQLHRANEQLHQARLDWEHTLDASEFRHQERVDVAWQKLLDLEHGVEELTQQIQTSFARND